MGNAWYCKKCEEGRIALSKSCAERFIDEQTGIEYTPEERWRNKLQCLDDVHSNTHGLTIENFNALADKIEEHAKKIRDVNCKNREDVIECLKKHPDCMIRCMEEMREFIDCVDTIRINIIKGKIEQSRKAAKQAEVDKLFNNNE